MKKLALILAVLLLACCLSFVLVACGENGQDGKDGANGRNGKDGLTPYIGTNGNWFIGDTDTGVLAQGGNGADGKDGTNGENGKDGLTPYIGANGNWFVGDKDTGILAQGAKGADGEDGKDGTSGKSAFELYKDSHPEFEGTEEDWLNGLIGNGRAPETGEFAYAKNADGVSYTLVSYTGTDFGVDIPVSYAGFPVTAIGDNTFKDNKSINSITIHNKITSIGSSAFEGCSGLTAVHITDLAAWCNISFGGSSANPLYYAKNLYLNGELVTDLVIPDTVTEIKSYAFYKCSGLTSITIPDSVISIGERAFWVCSSLTSVTIPDSVISIGAFAFNGCSGLTSVTIGNSVTSIGEGAFYNCSDLTSISFNGTQSQWSSVSKGLTWKYGSPATVVHCTDGDVSI